MNMQNVYKRYAIIDIAWLVIMIANTAFLSIALSLNAFVAGLIGGLVSSFVVWRIVATMDKKQRTEQAVRNVLAP